MPVNRVGILYHPLNKAAKTLAKKLEKFLVGKGVSIWLRSAWEWEQAKAQVNNTD